MPKSKDRLSKLPDEMLINIMLELDPEDFKYLYSVNKRINTICNNQYFCKKYREKIFRHIKYQSKKKISLYCRTKTTVTGHKNYSKFPSNSLTDSKLVYEWCFEAANKYIIYLRGDTKDKKDKILLSFSVFTERRTPSPYIYNFVKWFCKKYNFTEPFNKN